MQECEFCGEEFKNREQLHRHWEDHEDELNSHQKEKMKKARRKKEEEKDAKMQQRKQYLGYGLAAVIAIGFIGLVGAQLMSAVTESADLDLEDRPVLGDEDAPVTVVEFGDYRCPACGQFHSQTLSNPSGPDLKSEYIETGDANFVYLNFPVIDQNAPGETGTRAAVAAECVYRQDNDGFWNYHDALYESQADPGTDWATEDTLIRLFEQSTSGLDQDQFETCLSNRETMDQVEADRRQGLDAGVSATPTVYVNGDRVRDWGFESLSAEIESRLE